MDEFKEIKESIELALEEIKKQNPKLYQHLKDKIIMDEEKQTFCYDSEETWL